MPIKQLFLYISRVKKRKETGLDFEVDKLTNSIENAISGEVFETLVIQINDSKLIKRTDWAFDWQGEIKDKNKTVYGLATISNPNIIQGIISITDKGDHVFMDLIESAKFNKGKKSCIKALPAILLHLFVKHPLKKVMTALYLLLPRHNLLITTDCHWGQKYLAETECILTLDKHTR